MDLIKVLHIVRPAEGGMKEHLVSLVSNTDQARFLVAVACPQESSIYQELLNRGIKVFPISIVGELNPARDFKTIKELKGIIRQYQPDIVHTHSSKAGLVGRIAAKLTGVKVIVFTSHNSIFYEHMPAKKKQLFAAVERFLAHFTDKIIAVSEALKNEIVTMEGINAEKVVVVRNGINLSKFQLKVDRTEICRELGLNQDKPIVVTIARFAPQKGLTYLIDAIARLQPSEAQFLIVGDGPLKEELLNQVKTLNIEKNIIFAGLRRDVERILPLADCFVLPSVTEGLPLTILEAMAAARPVVATAVGGVPEVVKHESTGLLVPAGEPNALAKAIERILKDRKLAIAVAGNGYALAASEYSLEAMVQKILDIYQELILAK